MRRRPAATRQPHPPSPPDPLGITRHGLATGDRGLRNSTHARPGPPTRSVRTTIASPTLATSPRRLAGETRAVGTEPPSRKRALRFLWPGWRRSRCGPSRPSAAALPGQRPIRMPASFLRCDVPFDDPLLRRACFPRIPTLSRLARQDARDHKGRSATKAVTSAGYDWSMCLYRSRAVPPGAERQICRSWAEQQPSSGNRRGRHART